MDFFDDHPYAVLINHCLPPAGLQAPALLLDKQSKKFLSVGKSLILVAAAGLELPGRYMLIVESFKNGTHLSDFFTLSLNDLLAEFNGFRILQACLLAGLDGDRMVRNH